MLNLRPSRAAVSGHMPLQFFLGIVWDLKTIQKKNHDHRGMLSYVVNMKLSASYSALLGADFHMKMLL